MMVCIYFRLQLYHTHSLRKNLSYFLEPPSLPPEDLEPPQEKTVSVDSDITGYYSGTCLIRHTKGPGKCVGFYRMSECSDFILVNRNTFGP
jgi:hypothetical protein